MLPSDPQAVETRPAPHPILALCQDWIRMPPPPMRPEWASEILEKLDRNERKLDGVATEVSDVHTEVIHHGVRIDRLEESNRRHERRLSSLEQAKRTEVGIVEPREMGDITRTIMLKAAQEAFDQRELEKDAFAQRALQSELRKGKWSLFWKAAAVVGGIVLTLLTWAMLSQLPARHP